MKITEISNSHLLKEQLSYESTLKKITETEGAIIFTGFLRYYAIRAEIKRRNNENIINN